MNPSPAPQSGSGQTDLLDALRLRRSRRFMKGMEMPAGPLAFKSRHAPEPLTEEQQALLVFAASGITGHAVADLCYQRGEGGSIMAGLVGRTVASGDGLQTVALMVIDDGGVHLVRRPRELPSARIPDLIRMGQDGRFVDLYRECRVRIADQRVCPPTNPLFNINANRWSARAPATTTFLPINDLTFMYINGLLEVFNETTGAFVLDERNHYLPAGLARFAKSRGGHLDDNPHHGCVATVRQVEQFVSDFVTIEQGMMLQNLGLMCQSLGLAGYPHFANHEFGWFQALGFQLGSMPASQYVGAGPLVSLFMRLLRRNPEVPYPIGLERNGEVLLKPFCPPHYPSMAEAVRAVIASKFGPTGTFRDASPGTAWSRPDEVFRSVPEISQPAIDATIAYCEYLWNRYGRFPVHMPPYRTVMAFQAGHADPDFYPRFYGPRLRP